jgi:hypothetical protein
MLFHAGTNTLVCHLDWRSLDWPAICATPISNRTHLPLTAACSTAMLASHFISVKLKVPFWLERPSYKNLTCASETWILTKRDTKQIFLKGKCIEF